MRLFSLLHLLGQASLRMEQALWPEDYERMTREVEEALRQATDANARSYTHEEVMQAMQERIDRETSHVDWLCARLDAGSEPGAATRSLEQGRM
jgi:hypothetical protein